MVKRDISKYFHNKKGLKLAEILIYILLAIAAILIFGWAIITIKNRIFG